MNSIHIFQAFGKTVLPELRCLLPVALVHVRGGLGIATARAFISVLKFPANKGGSHVAISRGVFCDVLSFHQRKLPPHILSTCPVNVVVGREGGEVTLSLIHHICVVGSWRITYKLCMDGSLSFESPCHTCHHLPWIWSS